MFQLICSPTGEAIESLRVQRLWFSHGIAEKIATVSSITYVFARRLKFESGSGEAIDKLPHTSTARLVVLREADL
jgi:hypothetical protein